MAIVFAVALRICDSLNRQERHMPNSDLDRSPLSEGLLHPPGAVVLRERGTLGEFACMGAGLTDMGCPPDSTPTSVLVCCPDTRASEGELDAGDAGCAVDGSVTCRARSCIEEFRSSLMPAGVAAGGLGRVSMSAGVTEDETPHLEVLGACAALISDAERR